jgi:chemotaxis signal transduction protein
LSPHKEIPAGIVVFKIAEQDLCLDIRFLDGIIKPSELVFGRPGDAAEENRVVFNGVEYLIADFAPLFGKKESATTDKGRLLLIEHMEQKLAFHVDEVTQIITTGAGNESDLQFVVTDGTPNLSGYYRDRAKKLWQIDFDGLIGDSTHLPGVA